jgi:hypothetical protein
MSDKADREVLLKRAQALLSEMARILDELEAIQEQLHRLEPPPAARPAKRKLPRQR